MKPHKWQKEIIDWANGAAIQMRLISNIEMKWIDCPSPCWWDNNIAFRSSLAYVEGRPVFEGDVLYSKENGGSFLVTPIQGATQAWWDCWTWTRPQQTITVTIPKPKQVSWGYDYVYLKYDSSDTAHIHDILKEAMSSNLIG